jgi:hypothetical protein
MLPEISKKYKRRRFIRKNLWRGVQSKGIGDGLPIEQGREAFPDENGPAKEKQAVVSQIATLQA